MAKTLGLGTVLRVEDPNTPGTFIAVASLNNIPSPSVTKGEVEVTTFDSVAREFLGTLPDNGDVPFSGVAEASDAGQGILRADATDSASTVRNWEIYWERQGITCEFSGYLSSFTAFNSTGIDDAITMEGTIRVSGEITFTEDS